MEGDGPRARRHRGSRCRHPDAPRRCGRRRATSPGSPIRWWTASSASSVSAPTTRGSRATPGAPDAQCPVCGTRKGTLTAPRKFNLMFKTFMGPVEDDGGVVYLRPETAQGIYVNYLNVLQARAQKVPFGIAQIGKAFRNEITPRNFIFRTREFEQMEMQFFVQARHATRSGSSIWREERDAWHDGARHRAGAAALPPARRGRAGALRQGGATTSSTSSRSAGASSRGSTTAPTSTCAGTRMAGARSASGRARTLQDFQLVEEDAEWSTGKLSYFDQEGNERYIPYVMEPAVGADRGDAGVAVRRVRRGAVAAGGRAWCCACSRGWRRSRRRCCRWSRRTACPRAREPLYDALKKRWPVMYDDGGGDRQALSPAGRGGDALVHHHRRRHAQGRHGDGARARLDAADACVRGRDRAARRRSPRRLSARPARAKKMR